jgi:hypothetical protein
MLSLSRSVVLNMSRLAGSRQTLEAPLCGAFLIRVLNRSRRIRDTGETKVSARFLERMDHGPIGVAGAKLDQTARAPVFQGKFS